MCISQIITLIPSSIVAGATIIVASATIAYAIFSGITILKLNRQNELLSLDSYNKIASFLRSEWIDEGNNEIVKKLNEYSYNILIKGLEDISTKKPIEPELLTINELKKIIGLTLRLKDLIKENKLDIDTVLLYFPSIYGCTELTCINAYNTIIECINDLYKDKKDKKIEIINDFFNMIIIKHKYKELSRIISLKSKKIDEVGMSGN